MSFALSPYRREIANQLKPLRDFFLVLFFIHIGMQLQFDAITQHWFTIIVLTIFVSVVKPLLIWVSTKWYGFTNKTALKSALSLGQISEFSFLLIAIGISA
jgi:Kef-type K+ transport system membrane component KefB